MKQSKLFTKTTKEFPKDETSKNAQLLIRAGFVYKELAGVYSYLPLGLRVINKIAGVVREEMGKTGGVEMQSSTLQKKDAWEKSGRWDDAVIDNWFKTKLKNETELGLAFTHEEPIADMMKNFVSSYKDLPLYVYDVRNVFRNEARAKSGLMRGREFFWKALYSFSKNKAEHDEYYEKAKVAYKNVFDRVGLGGITYLTFASGGSFSKYSHEFQTLSESGEDIIYVDEKKSIAVNKEVFTDEVLKDLGLEKNNLIEKKAIEVGNIFTLGYKFSEPLGLKYKDENGKDQLVFMGCYGIGISRLLGTIVEVLNDDKGIIWPEEVAPFQAHLIELKSKDANIKSTAEKLYQALSDKGVEVLYDDREAGAGEKFADADLIGYPFRIVVSDKTIAAESVEVKRRNSDKAEMVKIGDLINKLNA